MVGDYYFILSSVCCYIRSLSVLVIENVSVQTKFRGNIFCHSVRKCKYRLDIYIKTNKFLISRDINCC